MKKWIPIVWAVGIMMLAACKEKKQSDDIIIAKSEVKKPQGTKAMQDYDDTKTVDWMRGKYEVRISRKASDELPMVTDADGQKYKDNTIRLVITRQDGSVFYDQLMTKEMFQSYLDESYRKGGVLEAMILDSVDGTQLHFAVSVCKPDSDDEFIPLVFTLTSLKGISIRRDTQIDTMGEGTVTDEDGV